MKAAIAVSLSFISMDGFISKAAAERISDTTAAKVRNHLDEKLTVNLIDERIDKVLDFLMADAANDFMRDAKSALTKLDAKTLKLQPLESISAGKLSFVAPVVNNFLRVKTNRIDKESLKALDFIGTAKQKGEFFVKLVKVIEKEDYKVHRVVDRNGNRGFFYHYKLQTDGSDFMEELSLDECFLIKATVARHQYNNYDGGKDTYFNRVTVVSHHGSTEKEEGA